MAEWFLGTMGFSYKQWVGAFYPLGMVSRNYLRHYSQRFNAVEMDSTFYGTPKAKTVTKWQLGTPDDFQICPKVPRQLTHDLRLLNIEDQLAHFVETMQLLGNNLGPVLIQLPPDFSTAESNNLKRLLPQLPSDVRFAIEFRHRSWTREETAVLLRHYNVCWVAADYIHLPKRLHKTADFLYLRFIGPHGQFATKDKELVDKTADLQGWHKQIQPHLPQTNAVYGFFNNDYSGHSPATCNKFKRIVGLETKDIRVMQQGRLF